MKTCDVDGSISLREYTDLKAEHLRETADLKAEHLRELMSVKDRASSQALQLQAGEYERRLEALNHAHQRAVEVQGTYVTQELFNAKQDETAAWREAVMTQLAETRGRTAAYMIALGIVFSAVEIGLRLIK